jgi:hypothetical protein
MIHRVHWEAVRRVAPILSPALSKTKPPTAVLILMSAQALALMLLYTMTRTIATRPAVVNGNRQAIILSMMKRIGPILPFHANVGNWAGLSLVPGHIATANASPTLQK